MIWSKFNNNATLHFDSKARGDMRMFEKHIIDIYYIYDSSSTFALNFIMVNVIEN